MHYKSRQAKFIASSCCRAACCRCHYWRCKNPQLLPLGLGIPSRCKSETWVYKLRSRPLGGCLLVYLPKITRWPSKQPTLTRLISVTLRNSILSGLCCVLQTPIPFKATPSHLLSTHYPLPTRFIATTSHVSFSTTRLQYLMVLVEEKVNTAMF